MNLIWIDYRYSAFVLLISYFRFGLWLDDAQARSATCL